jgi:predicted membrane protein
VRYRQIGALCLLTALLWLLNLLLDLDPVRTGLAILFIAGGYRLMRSGGVEPAEGIPGDRTTLVGAVHLMDREYSLQGFRLTCGITDIKIDLSRAIIPPGEHIIAIRGLVGDVELFVPYDLDISVAAGVAVGALNVMGEAGESPGRRGRYTTRGYAEAVSKVKIAVSLAIGDVAVRYL